MNVFKNLSLGVRVAATGIAAMGLVLVLAFAAISLGMWHDARDDGHARLRDAALSVSRLIDSFDETARQNAAQSHNVFKALFSAPFELRESAGPDGKARPVLLHGKSPVNGAFAEVDRFTELTGGVATLFARHGEDFERVTTSLKKQDGSRAMGTLLGPAHPAFALVKAGKPYLGRAELFGRTYMTKYEPILAEGKVIGIHFIGFDMTAMLATLEKAMREHKVFEHGAVYGVNLKEGPAMGRVFGLAQARKLDDAAPAAAALLAALKSGETGALTSPWSVIEATGEGPAREYVYVRNDRWSLATVAEVARDDMMRDTRRAISLLWATALGAVLALAATLLWVSRSMIARPIAAMAGEIEHLARGDLTHSCRSGRTDEMGRLMNAMEAFRLQLTGSLGTVRESAEAVASSSTQIASGNHDLSARTEQQAANLQQTASSMGQMAATVNQNADNAKQAESLATGATQVARQGREAVGAVVRTMTDIRDSSRRIADIITVIDGIAFQTNILALNAAVEAARAGEQGRGFAVVASEVRALAQRSATAAQEIKSLILESTGRVDEGCRQVEGAGSTMGEVVAQVTRVAQLIGEITAATHEQASGVGAVNESVSSLDAMTQQNAALVEQAAASADSLREQARRLAQAVAIFRLDGSPAAA